MMRKLGEIIGRTSESANEEKVSGDWLENKNDANAREVPQFNPVFAQLRREGEVLEGVQDDFVGRPARVAKSEVSGEKLTSKNNVYRRVARDALMNRNGLSEEEANERVANTAIDELEKEVGARGSIDAAVNSLATRLGLDADELSEAVYNGDNDSEIFGKLKRELGEIQGREARGDFVFGVLSDIHDQWIKNNKHKFFDEGRKNKRYQFMPLELIGKKEASSDLLFVRPILETADFEVEDRDMADSYEYHSQEFIDKRGVINPYKNESLMFGDGDKRRNTLERTLAEDIAGNVEEYYKDNDEIQRALRDTTVATEIAKQLIDVDPDSLMNVARWVWMPEKRLSVLRGAESATEYIYPEKQDEWKKYIKNSQENGDLPVVHNVASTIEFMGSAKKFLGEKYDENSDIEGVSDALCAHGLDDAKTLDGILRFSCNGPEIIETVYKKKYGPNYKEKLDQGMVKFIEDCRAENKRLVEKRPDTSNYQ